MKDRERSASRPESEKALRIAILGAGFISDFHIRALKNLAGVAVVAVCDPDYRRAQSLAARWNLTGAFRSLSEMLERCAADAVHVRVPPPCHLESAVRCLEAGCHVFMEKPVCVSVAECRQLQAAAARYQRTLGINHNAIHHPGFLKLVRAIRERRLGQVQHVTACVNTGLRQLAQGQHSNWMFQRPHHIVLEQAPHPLSQIHRLLGAVRQTAALASGAVRLNTGATFYDSWQISLICERGTAQCFLSFGREYSDSWLHAIGQDGEAFVDLRRNTIRLTTKTRFIDPVDNLTTTAANASSLLRQAASNVIDYSRAFLRISPPNDPFYCSFRDSIRHFYDVIRRGDPQLAGMAEGAAIIEACDQIASSACYAEAEGVMAR